MVQAGLVPAAPLQVDCCKSTPGAPATNVAPSANPIPIPASSEPMAANFDPEIGHLTAAHAVHVLPQSHVPLVQ